MCAADAPMMRDHAHFFRTKSNSPGRRGGNS
jgi:hypothetical protein